MKKEISSLQDALSYQLLGLLYAETKIRNEFDMCSHQITSPELKAEIQKYISVSDNKLLKIDRIFNYLMEEPKHHKNEVIDKLIEETHHMLAYTTSSYLKDILIIGCVQNINAYKISSYKLAYMFAIELELDTAADLVYQILEWELETSKALAAISIREFNRINNPVKSK